MLSTAEAAPPATHRGTTNRNCRGNTKDRRRRREWLIETYRADVDIFDLELDGHPVRLEAPTSEGLGQMDGDGWRKACRCYRCGRLLTLDTVTADRIKPGAEGGQYGTPLRDRAEGRTNVRPACLRDNSSTGGVLGAARKAAG